MPSRQTIELTGLLEQFQKNEEALLSVMERTTVLIDRLEQRDRELSALLALAQMLIRTVTDQLPAVQSATPADPNAVQ
jgi:hypothetical protein